jgi:transcription initiation factor TFIID subunit TAF12
MKLFADLERKRRQMENKISEDAGRKRETELAAEEKRSVEKEFNKNWEETRQGRVNSWLDFKHGKTIILPPDEYQQQQQQQQQQLQQQLQQQQQQQQQLQTSQMSASTSVPTPEAATAPVEKKKKKKEKRFNPMGFRPPKHKPESR